MLSIKRDYADSWLICCTCLGIRSSRAISSFFLVIRATYLTNRSLQPFQPRFTFYTVLFFAST